MHKKSVNEVNLLSKHHVSSSSSSLPMIINICNLLPDHIMHPLLLPVSNVNLVSFTLMNSHCFYICFIFLLGHLVVQLFAAFVSCWHFTFCSTSFIGVCNFVSHINLID